MRSSKSSPQAIGTAIQAQNGYRSMSREIAFFIVLLYHVPSQLYTVGEKKKKSFLSWGGVKF